LTHTVYGTDYKIRLRLSVCQCICVSAQPVRTLTVVFLDRFSPKYKIGTDVRISKNKDDFIGVNIAPLSSILHPNPHFRPRGPENSWKYYVILYALNVRKSPKFLLV